MAGWFGGGGGFPGMGGLGDRLLGGRGLPAGNPYTGGTGGAYGRGGGSAYGGYGSGEGSLSADARALAARAGGGYPMQATPGGRRPTLGTMPVGPQPTPIGYGPDVSTLPIGQPTPAGGGGLASTMPIGPPVMAGGGNRPGLLPLQAGRGMPFGGGAGSADFRFLNNFGGRRGF